MSPPKTSDEPHLDVLDRRVGGDDTPDPAEVGRPHDGGARDGVCRVSRDAHGQRQLLCRVLFVDERGRRDDRARCEIPAQPRQSFTRCAGVPASVTSVVGDSRGRFGGGEVDRTQRAAVATPVVRGGMAEEASSYPADSSWGGPDEFAAA